VNLYRNLLSRNLYKQAFIVSKNPILNMRGISKIFALIFTLTMAISSTGLLMVKPANAQYTQNGAPCPLGGYVEITSPTNSTYTSGSLMLSFYIDSIFDNTIYQYELSYSIDGRENVSIPSNELSFSLPNGDTGEPFTEHECSGSVSLSELDEGSHQLIVYATYVHISTNGGNYPSLIYSNSTVDFTILKTPTLNPTSPNSTSATVPEYPALAILPLLLSVFSVAVILRHRKTIKLNQ